MGLYAKGIIKTMIFGKNLAIDVFTRNKGAGRVVIEILFRGVHDHENWPTGKIQDYLRDEISKHEPDAIMMNFLNYQYIWGNELLGHIFEASFDSKKSRGRPCSIVARGQTAESIKSLLVEANVLKVLDVELFHDKEKALENLGGRLSSKTA